MGCTQSKKKLPKEPPKECPTESPKTSPEKPEIPCNEIQDETPHDQGAQIEASSEVDQTPEKNIVNGSLSIGPRPTVQQSEQPVFDHDEKKTDTPVETHRKEQSNVVPEQSNTICEIPEFLTDNDFELDPLEGIDLSYPDTVPVKLEDRIVYVGQWKYGKQSGNGTQTQLDGVVYTGQFKNGRIEGFGTLTRPDGSRYVGEFVGGKANTTHRHGIYYFKDGSKYIGQWSMDKRHGLGKELMSDGSVYIGQYKRGSRCGKGKMIAKTGDLFEGEFLNGEMHGEGKYCWPDQRVYEGQWSMSKMHGSGKFRFSDNRVYEGQFKDCKMEGSGVLTWPDTSRYEGEFKNGLPHGEGSHRVSSSHLPRKARWNQGVRVLWLEDNPNADSNDVPVSRKTNVSMA